MTPRRSASRRPDKKFAVTDQLYHDLGTNPLLRVYGQEFTGIEPSGKRPVYVVPPFEHWSSFKTLARRIIQWSLAEKDKIVRTATPPPHGLW